MSLILASASPRRRELLAQIGLEVQVHPVDLDEGVRAGETPSAYVERLAREKAQACAATRPFGASDIILAADTTVAVDDVILGKPVDFDDCRRMMTMLSGNTHVVYTAIAVKSGERLLSEVVASKVRFRVLAAQEIAAYWATGEPCDKAGGYGIQGRGAVFVQSIEGSYSSVVGLPLCETAALLEKVGLTITQCWGERV